MSDPRPTMTLNADEAQSAGRRLFEAERERRQIGLLSLHHPGMTLADAYGVQEAFVAEKVRAGGRPCGWKIGLTSRAMQQALGINTPDSGVLFQDMVFETGGSIPPDRFIEPRVEAEIAFILGRDLAGPGLTLCEVARATEAVTAALEILDTRIVRRDPQSGRTRTICDTVSDNAANAGIVLGSRLFALEAVDLRWVGAIVARNGGVEETGLGAGVLDNPLRAIVWLANRLAAQGKTFRAGDVVLSGSFIRPIEAPHGSTITADFGPFGAVACHFE